MNQVLIGIIIIAILIFFFNREKFTVCQAGLSAEKDMNNSANEGCARIDTSDRDYFFFKGKEVYCKNIDSGNKKGATVNTNGCPKKQDGTYKVDGASGNCAANIESKTGQVLICN